MVSKFMADVVFGKETDVINFVYNNRSLGQKIKDWIVDTLGITRKEGENDVLITAKRNFEKALGNAGAKNNKGINVIQYSYEGDTEDGYPIYSTDFSNELSHEEKVKLFKERITTIFNLASVKKNVGDKNIEVLGDKFTVLKNVYGDKYGTKNEKKAKINALYDMADILERAKYISKNIEESTFSNIQPKNKAHKDVKYWYKFRSVVIFDKVPYRITFSIRDKENEQYAYLIDFKEIKSHNLSNIVNKDLLRANRDPDRIVSQNEPTVNTSIRDNNRDDTAKYDKDINETEQASNDVETAEDIKEAVKSDDETDLVGSKESEQNLANDEDMGYKENEEDKNAQTEKYQLNVIEKNTHPQVLEHLKKRNIETETFMELIDADRQRELTEEEKELVRNIAREIDVPQPRETIRKIFPKSKLEEILTKKFFSGYFANKKHVEGLKTMDEIFYGLRFDYENTKFNLTDDFYLAFDSAVSETDGEIMYIPFGDERYPATGLGFTGSKRGIFPEYKLRKQSEKDREYQGGDTLYVIDAKTGEARTTYEYNERLGWIKKENKK